MTFMVAVGTTETGLTGDISAPDNNPDVMTDPPSATLSKFGKVDHPTRIEPTSFVDANGRVDLPEATEDLNLDVTAADPGSDHRDHVAFLNSDRLVEEDGSE